MLLRSGLRVAAQDEARRATVPRRRSSAGPDRLAGFPEDILQEILGRLPAKSVLRCRAVCPLWRRLASDPAFLLDHHRRQPELALIGSYRAADGAVRCPRLEAPNLRDVEIRPALGIPELFPSGVTVRASCDGLLIIGNYICNPATRQWAPLSPNPKLRVDNLLGLFRHQPSGEYRVLYWRYLPSADWRVRCPHEYRVLTVGASESRHVDPPLNEEIGSGPAIYGAWVLVNGSLHMYSFLYHKILVFDTSAETFWQTIPPVNPRHVMHLLDMGGRLAVSTSKGDMAEMSIFTPQSSEPDVWAFRCRIELPVMDLRRFQEQGDWLAKVVSKEGDVLVSCYGQLLHCDKGGNLVAHFKFDDTIPVVFHHRLKESLIQHTLFPKEGLEIFFVGFKK